MSRINKTPTGAADRVKDNVVARQSEPHIQEDVQARQRRKRDNRSTSRGRSRGRSRYRPGKAFQPPQKTLAKRQREVLELLKERGPSGVTKLDAPRHLSLTLTARIFDLRSKGYQIDTLREQVGASSLARYVLVATDRAQFAAAGSKCNEF